MTEIQAKNRLYHAVAGAGKTTTLVEDALSQPTDKRILITTYTIRNLAEIRSAIMEQNSGIIPLNITLQTWQSVLFRECARPYQLDLLPTRIESTFLVNSSTTLYKAEADAENYYLIGGRMPSDVLAKFAIRCNEKNGGAVIDRFTAIYDSVYLDEFQDIAGYDFLFIEELMKSPRVETILAGDPRQTTYLTHPDRKFAQYKDSTFMQYVIDSEHIQCEIIPLVECHRSHEDICIFSSHIYPELPASKPCTCKECRDRIASKDHVGVFLVSEQKVEQYIKAYNPTILRYREAKNNEINFGLAKGITVDRALIYSTKEFLNWLIDGKYTKISKVKKNGKTINETKPRFDLAKLYVGCTRSRYSLAIVCSEDIISEIPQDRLAQLKLKVFE